VDKEPHTILEGALKALFPTRGLFFLVLGFGIDAIALLCITGTTLSLDRMPPEIIARVATRQTHAKPYIK